MKLFQFDKKTWDNGEVSRIWQFGIFKRKSLLWVNFENPSTMIYSSGGWHIMIGLPTKESLFGVELTDSRVSFAVYFFADYFVGWN